MYRKIAATVLVALLVTIAGCSGAPGGAGDGSESTDGGATEGADGGGDSPPHVANRTAVLAVAGSYTSIWRMTAKEDGVVVGETAYTTAIDDVNERSFFRMTQTSDGETTDGMNVYHADGVSYTRYGTDDDATYTAQDGEFHGAALFEQTRYITDADDLGDFSRVGTETFDGVTVTRYELTERPAWIGAGQAPDAEIQWSEFSFEVLIDEDGLVRQETWSGTGTDDDGVTHTFEFYSAVTDVGSTTVEEPEWVSTAEAESGQ